MDHVRTDQKLPRSAHLAIEGSYLHPLHSPIYRSYSLVICSRGICNMYGALGDVHRSRRSRFLLQMYTFPGDESIRRSSIIDAITAATENKRSFPLALYFSFKYFLKAKERECMFAVVL